MEGEDHYIVLGLPSGEEGAKLTEEEIKKAYRSKLRKLHPDKRPDDPNAHINFLNLQTSYDILTDKKARQIFDQKQRTRKSRDHNSSSKRRRKTTGVDEREQATRAACSAAKAARDMEESISRSNDEFIARIRRDAAAAASKAPPVAAAFTLNKQGEAKQAASTQCPCGHCQGDWFDREFSSNLCGAAEFEEYENSLLSKFRKA